MQQPLIGHNKTTGKNIHKHSVHSLATCYDKKQLQVHITIQTTLHSMTAQQHTYCSTLICSARFLVNDMTVRGRVRMPKKFKQNRDMNGAD